MTTVLIVLLWASAVWLTFGMLASIAMVGKPRQPLTGGMAVVVVATSAVIVGTLVAAAISLA